MGRRGGRGYRGGGWRRLHTYRYTVTTRMTCALRLAAMRSVLMFHWEGQSHKTVSRDRRFWRERRAKADLNQGPSAYQPDALLLGPTGSRQALDVWLGTCRQLLKGTQLLVYLFSLSSYSCFPCLLLRATVSLQFSCLILVCLFFLMQR